MSVTATGWRGRPRGSALSGWVRNRVDGKVEAVVAGPEPAVLALLTLARRGPMLARVDAVEESFFEDEVEPGFIRL